MQAERALDGRAAPAALAPGAETLARAARGGDLVAFEALVRRYERRVFALAFHHLHDPVEAQDLAQEVFVRLFRGLERYDPARPFEPWFWRLAGNVAASYRRRRPAAAAELPDWAPADAREDTLPPEQALAHPSPDPPPPRLPHYYPA